MRTAFRLPAFACALILLAFNSLLAGQSAPAVTIVYRFSGVGTDNEDTFCFADTREHMGLSLLYARLAEGRDGNFYGTIWEGGSAWMGSFFKITPAGTLTTLRSFTGKGDDPAYPGAGLILGSDGNFYGTTEIGGSNGEGTVFKITPAGELTVLHSFGDEKADGIGPFGGLVLGRDGNFYGTTTGGGGKRDAGTVFRITPAGVLTILHGFAGKGGEDKDYSSHFKGKDAEGAHPACLVQGRDGNFYGTTSSGGSRARGTVFKITPAGGFTTLHNFTGKGTDGIYPCPALALGSDGNFYGATIYGGSSGPFNDGFGTVFQITPAGVYTSLHSFTRTGGDGTSPQAGVVQGSDGNLYGTTLWGGINNHGTVFRIRMKDEG